MSSTKSFDRSQLRPGMSCAAFDSCDGHRCFMCNSRQADNCAECLDITLQRIYETNTAAAPWNPERNRYCCDTCGYYVGKYDRFCAGCGRRLTDWTPDGRGKH